MHCAGPNKVREGGVRALWKRFRARDRSVCGFGKGRVSKCSRIAGSSYVQARTEKGKLVAWRERLGRVAGFDSLCLLCVCLRLGII